MKIFDNPADLTAALRTLSEYGLIAITVDEGGEAEFALSDNVSESGPNAIATLLRGIEAIADPRNGS